MYLRKSRNPKLANAVKTLTLSTGLIATCLLLAPSPILASHASELNNTAEVIPGRMIGVQNYTTPSNVVMPKLERGSYTVYNPVEEQRQVQLASVESKGSFLTVTEESETIHDKNDGTVIYPMTFWFFEPDNNGYHTSERPDHNGVDFPNSIGTEIYSIADGIITKIANEPGGYGNYMIVEHNINGRVVTSLYAHQPERPAGEVGDKVTKGQIIGHVGNTGRSTGPHLHFEITLDGVSQDPASWLELNALR